MILRASLPVFAKRLVWNMKYGLLGYPVWPSPSDVIQYLIPRLTENSSILELGCGRGSVLRGLRCAGWAGYYCGVDISKRAMDDARSMADQRSSWIVSDIEGFESPFQWDSIIMIESIYYVKINELPRVLAYLQRRLKRSGFMLFRIHDFQRHREYVDCIQAFFREVRLVDENLLCVAGAGCCK